MVYDAAPTTPSADTVVMTARNSTGGGPTITPKAGEEQALLLKLATPVWATRDVTRALIMQTVAQSGIVVGPPAPPWGTVSLTYTYTLRAIGSDFDYTGAGAAVWDDGLQDGDGLAEITVKVEVPEATALANVSVELAGTTTN
ncbi:MAG TPA: hypothetical protein VMZ92_02365, partial [Planctomycetota bacterium]|nr:hypothetical protein [Planctomycetota bacterium]